MPQDMSGVVSQIVSNRFPVLHSPNPAVSGVLQARTVGPVVTIPWLVEIVGWHHGPRPLHASVHTPHRLQLKCVEVQCLGLGGNWSDIQVKTVSAHWFAAQACHWNETLELKSDKTHHDWLNWKLGYWMLVNTTITVQNHLIIMDLLT